MMIVVIVVKVREGKVEVEVERWIEMQLVRAVTRTHSAPHTLQPCRQATRVPLIGGANQIRCS